MDEDYSMETYVYNALSGTGDLNILEEMHNTLGIPKSQINSALESLANKGLVYKNSCTPPHCQGHWRQREYVEDANENKTEDWEYEGFHTFILIDYGNIHDVAKHLIPYAQKNGIYVMGFADRAYFGYPVNQKPPPAVLPYFQSQTMNRNAADVEMIAFVIERCNEATARGVELRFFCLTKDQQFQQLKIIAERKGHRFQFMQKWEGELQFIVE